MVGSREMRALVEDRGLCRVASAQGASCVVALHHLSGLGAHISRADLPGHGPHLRELLCDGRSAALTDDSREVVLPPHGFQWLRREELEVPAA